MLKERINNGTDKPCITGNVLKDPEAKLNDGTCRAVIWLSSLDCPKFDRLVFPA